MEEPTTGHPNDRHSAPLRPARRPDTVALGRLPPGRTLIATARLLGAAVDTASLASDPALAAIAGPVGLSFVFHYGVAVTTCAEEKALQELDSALQRHVFDPADVREMETATLVVEPDSEDRLGPGEQIVLANDSQERLLLVATALSHSVILARDELLVSEVFDRASPIIAVLRETGRIRLSIRTAMRLVGDVLAARDRMIGKAQVGERPDLLWDHPELDRLYARLEAEYELKERAEVLERKWGMLGDFTTALLNIIQDKRAVRLEAAIIALIVFEIVLNLVSLVPH